MKWVTWENVAVDRITSAWLIRRWIDPAAEFVFVPAGSRVLPEGAEAFDIPGARFSHHRGRCTFHTLLREHGLKDPVLGRIARIVDEADVVQEVALEPAAPGLDLICRGLRRISAGDAEALARGAFVCDALYAQLAADGLPDGAPEAEPA
jgi:hypothetical protein